MSIEIEKKYRLSIIESELLISRLQEIGAEFCGHAFEENTIYTCGPISSNSVLRLRRVNNKAILTFKKRFASASPIKRQQEVETIVDDASAMSEILELLGHQPAVVYEKRRATWRLPHAEVVVDELPFGLFVEIEGEETAIEQAEMLLGLDNVVAELSTYPQLTIQYGQQVGDRVESRFD